MAHVFADEVRRAVAVIDEIPRRSRRFGRERSPIAPETTPFRVDGDGAEIIGRRGGERTVEASDRGAGRADDDASFDMAISLAGGCW